MKHRVATPGDRTEGTKKLRQYMQDGATWEMSSAETYCNFVCAIASKKPKKFKPKRLGTKAVKAIEMFENVGDVLTETQATAYRALAARANYLALDRTDIAYATKELCRDFAKPTSASLQALKHCVRYLKHHPRLVWRFDYDPDTTECTVSVDTEFAGCHKTRRSTSDGFISLGSHTLRHWSVTQATIALSSAEAELVGLVRGAAQSLGFQAMMRDAGFECALNLQTDATAAIGICRRRGIGKIRHLAVSDLWIQEKLQQHVFSLKSPGQRDRRRHAHEARAKTRNARADATHVSRTCRR